MPARRSLGIPKALIAAGRLGDDRTATKLLTAALTLAVHVAALWLLMHAPVRIAPHETIVYLPITPPTPARAVAKPAPRAVPPAKTPTPHTVLPKQPIPPPLGRPVPEESGSALRALHGALFGCAPEAIEDAEDRKRCAAVAGPYRENPTAEVMDHPSHAVAQALWARQKARKNAPTLLPCMPPGLGTIFCAAQAAMDGLDLDAQPGYFDKPETYHVPNNGDPKRLPTELTR